AFRVPCCDSLNTPSPRFFAEIFNKTTPGGNFLGIDTSVCNVFTSNDPEVPRELVIDPDGRDKFRKYIPADRSFVNTVEDYPYPYVINRLCWEFPCVTPSDWSAQHLQKPNNPDTVRDLKAALDITVLKQGVYCLVFHPHGWIRNDQVIELIDHAVEKHGKKVKFLTFREALERLNQHALEGTGLRQDEPLVSTRLLDANNDGFMDSVCRFADFVSSGNVWTPETKSWISWSAPTGLRGSPPGILKEPRFGIFHNDGFASMLCTLAETYKGFHFDGEDWVPDPVLNALPRIAITTGVSGQSERDEGLRFRDLDNDGCCEFIVSNEREQAIYQWSADKKEWASCRSPCPPARRLSRPTAKTPACVSSISTRTATTT
ncbi:MAG: dehydrogenase, partial [Planctomycetes bacterium]|nr:dehydrogenase [Planctomycetota bacterium]